MSKTTITIENIHEFASSLMFTISPEQANNLLLEFQAIEDLMTIVKTIDTTNIEAMHYPLKIINNFLRSDLEETNLETKDVIACAPKTEKNYIIINQVINNEN